MDGVAFKLIYLENRKKVGFVLQFASLLAQALPQAILFGSLVRHNALTDQLEGKRMRKG